MADMNIEGTRRVMETTSHETANQYLRFGWSLINQYVVEATADQPAAVTYVLASVRRLEDTRQLVTLTDGRGGQRIPELGLEADRPARHERRVGRLSSRIDSLRVGLAERRSAAAAGRIAASEARVQHGRTARRRRVVTSRALGSTASSTRSSVT